MNAITHHDDAKKQRAGGWAALYLSLSLIAAMPYFLLVVNYEGATTAAQKVGLVIANYGTMYAMTLADYQFFGFALAVLSFALYDRFRDSAPFMARLATAAGLLWAVVLFASGMIETFGMTTIVDMYRTNPAGAINAWGIIEPVANALGSAGGELIGGTWTLLVCLIALRGRVLPRSLSWFGALIGAAGILSAIPPLRDAVYLFGLGQIVWLTWLGVAMLRTKATASERASAPSTARVPSGVGAGQPA
jgi:hypothetical protein